MCKVTPVILHGVAFPDSSIEDAAARERITGEATAESTMWETLGVWDRGS